MDWNDAALLARTLMNEHGLGHVPFKGNNRRKAFGVTKFLRPDLFSPFVVASIALSKPLVECNDEPQVRDTILHEIAHAKAGHGANHGSLWKMTARAIGCNAERLCGDDVKLSRGRYEATCACGIAHPFYRMPTRGKLCRHCRQRLDIRRVEAL
jgi:SprT protein